MISSSICKTIHTSLAALCPLALLFLLSCSDENQEARTPVATVSVDKTDLRINESMEITFTGVADQVVVYTGDETHDYSLRSESNTGFVANKGVFSYSYSVPGTFHVVVVASTYDTYLGNGLQTDTYEFDVTVTDDVTTIDQLYSNITPNVYYAELIGEHDWVMRIPTKQVYNRREVNLNAARQRLTFSIASDSSKIYVDDVLHETRTFYDLTKKHDIRVVAHSGDVRDYTLYTLVYPEFTTLQVDGTAAKLERNAYYQDLLTYTVGSATPEQATVLFTVPDDVEFLADGEPVASGATLDLQSAESHTYLLRRTLPGRPDIVATSRIVFNRTSE